MSGGSLNYFYTSLQDHVGDFADKELDDLVSDLAELFKDREWYLSGDTGDGTWAEARDEFKAKWFTEHGRQQRIEKYLAEIRKEVLEMFGRNKGKCKNCVHWKRETEYYGRCKYHTGCLMHRSDSCEEKFENKEVKANERNKD